MKFVGVRMPDDLYSAILAEVGTDEEKNLSRWIRDAIRTKIQKVPACSQ